MKFSIGKRLFLAVLLAIVAVAAVAVELARWQLLDNFAERATTPRNDATDALLAALAAQYRHSHDWSFVPADALQRKTWLRDQLLDSQRESTATTEHASTPSATLGYRLGLLDPQRRYLAGVVASRLLIALTSIDTREQPLLVDGQIVGYLRIARAQNPDDELAVAFLLDQQRNLAMVGWLIFLASGLAAAALAANFRQPIRQLVRGAGKLGQAEFGTRLAVTRSDELGELADTFNQLAARLENAEQRRRQWVADTSHELRTPLAVLHGQLEAMQDGIRDPTPEHIALMLRQVRSLGKLVGELDVLARADVGQLAYTMADIEVWPLLRETVADFAARLSTAGLTLTLGDAPAPVFVHGDADRLRQVLRNLLENSVRYTDRGGQCRVGAVVQAGQVHVEIEDSAPAVPPAALARLGERFFRVEASRNRDQGGSGLGLALCTEIVAAHGGRLAFAAAALGGLRVTLILPRVARDA